MPRQASRERARPKGGVGPWRRLALRSFAVVAAATLLCPGRAPAEPETPGEASWLARDRLVGDRWGVRTQLERLGVEALLFYNQLVSVKPSGGGADPDTVFGTSGSYDLFVLGDFEALTGWRGGGMLLQVKGQYDRNINQAVGALSDPIDDADFDAPIYVAQIWLSQALFERRLRLQIGYMQQQTLVDRNAFANSEDRQFLSTFLDNNPVVPLPVGLGVAVIAGPWHGFEIAAVMTDGDNVTLDPGFDTAFDDVDSISWFVEASFDSPFASSGRPGRSRLGVFVDGRDRVDFGSGIASRGHAGAWLSVDQVLWSTDRPLWGRLGAFARAGYADPDVNAIAYFWSFGLEHAGAWPARPRDALGFAVYQTIGSSVYRAFVDPTFDSETGIELYYAFHALGWLVLSPDLQVIVDPGADGRAGTAVVATLRARLAF